MSTYPVNVTGIAPTTTEAQLNDFFTFCGKIESIESKGTSATIHFQKPSAAKTALMLNGGTLDNATLSVTSDVDHQDEEHNVSKDGHPIEQSDKPRAGIAAEYLAKGYQLSDKVLHRAIEIDGERGISKRFLDYFNSLNTSLGARALGPDQTITGRVQSTMNAAAQQAKSVDEQKGITKTAFDYYSKALTSPLGQKVHAFYTSTSKQVLDIHEEARRLASEQHPQHSASTEAPTAPSATEPITQAAPAGV